MGAVRPRAPLVACLLCVFAASLTGCSKPSAPDIPLLEPGLWTFEIETSREGKPVETRTIRDCVELRGLYSAERPTDCKRIEATRSPDGKKLIVEMECAVPARASPDRGLPEDRGRGPLDDREPGLSIRSRSVFTGDLRRKYHRDNLTIVESPPGERQTTRSVTRGVWQAAACPADLPPDDLRRWIRMPEPVVSAMDGAEDASGRPPSADRPVMRAGLWSRKRVMRTDRGSPITEETQHCITGLPDRGGVSIPKMETWSICGSSYRTDVVSTPEGFDMTLRCEASSTHYMIADLDFDRTGPVIESRSRYTGDFAARFSVHHQTEVRQASGRRRSIDSKSEFVRIDDCPRDVGAVPPVSAEAVAEAEAPVPALSLWRSVVDRHTTSGFGAEDDPAVAAAVAGVLADTRVTVMCRPEPQQASLSEVFGPSDSGRGLRSARTEGRESEQRLSLFGYRVRLHSPWATLVADNGFVMNLTRTVRLHTSDDRYVDERWSDSQPLRAGRLNDASKTTRHWVTTYERLGSCPPGMPIGILMKDPAAPPKSAPAP